MIQTIALIIDAYRDLNARKLFWITLILSGIVMVAFAFLGVSEPNLTFAKWHFDMTPLPASVIYKTVFSYVVIGIWLSWAAIILALVSTSGIFPDLISGGTIDLYLSKPIGRLRLFLTKYFTGLLFVTLQVSLFSVGTFIVFGWRAHQWLPSLFLAIPIVVCLFSYLFAFCVLLGVWTRSTIAALLLTVLLWLMLWGAQTADNVFMMQEVMLKTQVRMLHRTISDADAELAKSSGSLTSLPHEAIVNYRKKSAQEQLDPLEKNLQTWHTVHSISNGVCIVIPKTSQTKDLLDRWLISDEEARANERARMQQREERQRQYPQNSNASVVSPGDAAEEGGEEIEGIVRHRSLWYVIGTSLLCEGLVLSLAAWIFCRRDY